MKNLLKEFRVYRGMSFALYLLPFHWWNVVGYGFFFFFIYYLRLSRILIFIITMLFIGSCFYDVIGYLLFRKKIRQLPFHVDGWENFVNKNKFEDSWYWADVEIILHISPETNFSSQHIASLWDSFIEKAHKQFYPSEPASCPIDRRNRWKVEGNKAYGSMNCAIAAKFYLFLINQIAPLERNSHFLESVSLKMKNNELYKVEYLYVPD